MPGNLSMSTLNEQRRVKEFSANLVITLSLNNVFGGHASSPSASGPSAECFSEPKMFWAY